MYAYVKLSKQRNPAIKASICPITWLDTFTALTYQLTEKLQKSYFFGGRYFISF